MPTGYTDMIDYDPKITTQRWVVEGLVRAFGIAVTLRDDSFGLSEKEIRNRIAKDSSSEWNRKELEKVRSELKAAEVMSEEEWRERWQKQLKDIRASNARSKREASKKKRRHDRIRADLIRLRNETTDEATRNIASFGLDQLDVVEDYDCKPFLQDEPSFEDYKASTLKCLVRDIGYYKEEQEEARVRVEDRVQTYDTLRSEVVRVLGKEGRR